MTEPTHEPCPANRYGDTHHLRPASGVLRCEYCGKTEADLRVKQSPTLATNPALH